MTGHEIGHSWGSYHDPATTPSCSNVFIMNQYAQDGSQPTHKVGPKTSIGIEFKWGGEINKNASCYNQGREASKLTLKVL